MADTHSPTPHAAPRPAPAGSRRMVWIGAWAGISIVWLIGSWLYFFTFAPPIRSGSPYAPLSAEEKACISRYSDKDRQKSCRDLMAVQTQGDVTGQYFTRAMFVFVPPLLLGFALWIKLAADKERAIPVGRPAHLMHEGGYSPHMEEAMAEQDEKRRRENMPPEIANLFGKGQQGGRR